MGGVAARASRDQPPAAAVTSSSTTTSRTRGSCTPSTRSSSMSLMAEAPRWAPAAATRGS